MKIKYDYPDMPIGTPMTMGHMLVINGKELEISPEEFKLATGLTPAAAAKSTANLTVIREKVS